MNANERTLITFKQFERAPETRAIKDLRRLNMTLDGEEFMLEFSTPPLPGGKFEYVTVEITNDPTPQIAGGTVSLGYYVLRISLTNAVMTSTSVSTQIRAKMYSFRLSRPARIPHDFLHEEGTQSIITPLAIPPDVKARYTMLFSKPHDKYWWWIATDEEKETTTVKGIDPNSLYHPMKVFPPTRRKPSQTVVYYHETVVNELLEEL